jgi:hypothetical protein
MARSSVTLRLAEIIEAIDRLHEVVGGASFDASRAIGNGNG